jgi:hypothetical protein
MPEKYKETIFFITGELLQSFHKLYIKFVKQLRDEKADVCLITADKNQLYFKTSNIHGTEPISDKAGEIIRSKCGQNMLLKYGIVNETNYLPSLYLLVDISVIKYLGILKTIKLIKDWPGQSTIEGGKRVVLYKLWGS